MYEFKNNTWLMFDDCLINFEKVVCVKLKGCSLTFVGDNESTIHTKQYDSSERAESDLEHIKDLLNEVRH